MKIVYADGMYIPSTRIYKRDDKLKEKSYCQESTTTRTCYSIITSSRHPFSLRMEGWPVRNWFRQYLLMLPYPIILASQKLVLLLHVPSLLFLLAFSSLLSLGLTVCFLRPNVVITINWCKTRSMHEISEVDEWNLNELNRSLYNTTYLYTFVYIHFFMISDLSRLAGDGRVK